MPPEASALAAINAPAAAPAAGAPTGTPTPAAAPAGGAPVVPAANAGEYAYAADWQPEIREAVVKAGFKDVQGIASAYIAAQKLIGVPADQIIRMPKADDLTGMRAAIAKFGVPAKVEDYKIDVGAGADPEFVKTAAGWFHEVGIPAWQGKELAKKWEDFGNKQIEAGQTAWATQVTKDTTELHAEWGDNKNVNLLALKEAQKFGGFEDKEIDAMARAVGLKKTFAFLAKVGTPLLPDQFKGGQGGGSGAFNTMTAQEAAARRTTLMSDREWGKRYIAGDREARAEMDAINAALAGAMDASAGVTYSQGGPR